MEQESIPFWMKGQKLKNYPSLKTHAGADVCIVGAGISGLMTAYLLCREGKKVIVLDDGLVAGGQTMRTTAHLANALDDHYYELEDLFGKRAAKLAADSHGKAIDLAPALPSFDMIFSCPVPEKFNITFFFKSFSGYGILISNVYILIHKPSAFAAGNLIFILIIFIKQPVVSQIVAQNIYAENRLKHFFD